MDDPLYEPDWDAPIAEQCVKHGFSNMGLKAAVNEEIDKESLEPMPTPKCEFRFYIKDIKECWDLTGRERMTHYPPDMIQIQTFNQFHILVVPARRRHDTTNTS